LSLQPRVDSIDRPARLATTVQENGMNDPAPSSTPLRAPPSRARRGIAKALVMLLTYLLALNLLWEMWSETGTFGIAMDASMWLFGVPGRFGVYMLLPWVHAIAAIVLGVWLYRLIVRLGPRDSAETSSGARANANKDGGPGFFAAWGLLTIAVTASFAGLKYLGEHAIEEASAGQPAQVLDLANIDDPRVLGAPTQLVAAPLESAIIQALPLHRKTSAKRTMYVPLIPTQGQGAELRAVLQFQIPLRQDVTREDWAPPFAVRRLFAPIPTWVRSELARQGHPVASDAVLVDRVSLDANGRALPPGVSARAEAMIIAGIGGFVGLLLIGLEFVMRRR
jgi:hypothetical protein